MKRVNGNSTPHLIETDTYGQQFLLRASDACGRHGILGAGPWLLQCRYGGHHADAGNGEDRISRCMNIVLTTSGSRGDVQPVLALALALKAAGHRMSVAAPPENARWIESLGCRFHPLGGNFEALLNRQSDAHSASAAVAFLRFVRRDIHRQFRQLPSVMKAADCVIAASLSFAAPTLAQHLGIPYAFLAFCPQVLPSPHHPPPTVMFHGLPKWLNRGFWWLDRQMDRMLLRPLINRHRRHLGLAPIQSTLDHLLGGHVIMAADAELAPVPPGVTRQVTQIGSLRLAATHAIETGLDHFIKQGPPPVFVGFGSMPKQDLNPILPRVIEAARACQQRLVVAVGSLRNRSSDPNVWMAAGNLPHPLVFSKMSVVVHHGGAGTTATAARAGVPQIVIPHVLDQYYWAQRIYRLGLGPRSAGRMRLTSRRLAAWLQTVSNDDGYRKRAAKIARRIAHHDSPKDAVCLIESGTVFR